MPQAAEEGSTCMGWRALYWPGAVQRPCLVQPQRQIGQVLQAQSWESEESWISSAERRRLAGESRGKSSQGPGNRLFQEDGKLGPVAKMTKSRSLGCSASSLHCSGSGRPPVPCGMVGYKCAPNCWLFIANYL